jgi:hypothetical protein
MFSSSVLAVDINAIGVDFIARGFTHIPFFILLIIAVFDRRPLLRCGAIFVAALTNGYMMLMVVPYFLAVLIVNRRKEEIYPAASSLLGLAIASLMVSSAVTEKPFYFVLVESFYLNPVEIIKHGAPFIILSFFYRQKAMIILLIMALIFGALIHYNPFFPVFIIYFSGAMILAAGKKTVPQAGLLAWLIAAVMFIGFLYAVYDKYDPRKWGYYPRYETSQTRSFDWIRENTKRGSTFMALTADEHDLGLLMQIRPVYLGYIGHISHLGINWRDRYNDITRTYRMGIAPDEVEYIYYGPIEKKYYPDARLPFTEVFRDEQVTIYSR